MCNQLVGFISPQMLLDVFATMTVSTRPSRLSKPISMVADITFTFWPLATLIDNYFFPLPSNPSSCTTSSLTYDVSLPSYKKINLQTSLPMFQNDRNGTQDNNLLCMFLYCFIHTGLVFFCHGCVSLYPSCTWSYFLLVK